MSIPPSLPSSPLLSPELAPLWMSGEDPPMSMSSEKDNGRSRDMSNSSSDGGNDSDPSRVGDRPGDDVVAASAAQSEAAACALEESRSAPPATCPGGWDPPEDPPPPGLECRCRKMPLVGCTSGVGTAESASGGAVGSSL